jgi:hypothetical protein
MVASEASPTRAGCRGHSIGLVDEVVDLVVLCRPPGKPPCPAPEVPSRHGSPPQAAPWFIGILIP